MMNKIDTPILLKFYIVRNQSGQYYRAKGYGGYGSSWVDDIEKAKVYGRIGPARSQVTFWTSNYPKYGAPVIIELHAIEGKVLDETERVAKALRTKRRQELLNKLYTTEDNLRRAQNAYNDISGKLAEINEKEKIIKDIKEQLKKL